MYNTKIHIRKIRNNNEKEIKKLLKECFIKGVGNSKVKLAHKEANEDIKYVENSEQVYLRKIIFGRNKLQPYWNDKECIVTRNTNNIYEIQVDEGKCKVINK